MSKTEPLVRIVTEVSNECRKKLKKIAIDKEVNLSTVVKEILERAVSKKKDITEEIETTE